MIKEKIHMSSQKAVIEINDYSKFREYKQTHDPKLRDEIVSSYIYIAEILSRKFANKGIEYEDIYQVASLGLIYAAERFDPERGIQFATFATPTVAGEIRRYFRDSGNFVRIPRKLYSAFCKVKELRQTIEGISDEEIAQQLNLPLKTVKAVLQLNDKSFVQSIDESEEESGLRFSNIIGEEDNEFLMIENRDFYDYCLKNLTDEEKVFIHMRYSEEKSQQKIAAALGISQMQVSRMEKNILNKFRSLYFRD